MECDGYKINLGVFKQSQVVVKTHRIMNKGRSLQNLLRDHSISADEFLETQGISSQIRSNLSRFVDYCRTHRPFILRMLQLAFNISYENLEDPRIRAASHTANEIFGNEETEVAELFFEHPPSLNAASTDITEEIVEGIQSEAERLFRFDDEEEETLPPEEPREVEVTGEELIGVSLSILKNPELNETCLGHLQKMYSFLIRHEPIPVLMYFDNHPEMLELLFKSIRYSSVSTLLAQLLTSEDKKKEYKFESLKKMILERVVEEIFQQMADPSFFDGAIVFLDQILSVTKQSYYEYFEDFMRISNYLVSEGILKRFYDELFKLEEASFLSTSKFLENLFLRINGEVQDNRYYHKEEAEQSMNFQIGIFLDNITTLLNLTYKIQSFNSIAKIHYLSFLDALLNTPQAKATPLSINDPSFMSLFEAYKAQLAGGMYKSKIYNLISGILSRTSEADSKTFLDQHQQIYQQYFTTIKAANYSNTKVYNKNEASAFDVSLIAKLTRKEESALADASKVVGKDLKRICKKYDTKIATFQNYKTQGEEQESIFGHFNTQNSKGSEGSGSNQTLVGKNNISIPTLHLPERFHNLENKDKDKDRSPEMPSNQLNDSPKEIVEEEQEVVSLTSKLENLREENGISLTAILREKVGKPDEDTRWPDNLVIPKQQRWEKEQNEEDMDVRDDRFKKEKSKPGQVAQTPKTEIVQTAKEVSSKSETPSCKSVVKCDSEKVRFFARHLPIFC